MEIYELLIYYIEKGRNNMGVFGLFYFGMIACAKVASDISEALHNENNRKEAFAQKQEIYVDSKGCERLISNNQKVIKTYIYYDNNPLKTKDYVLKKVGSNEIIRNYSQEEREQQENYYYKKAIELGRTAYRLGGLQDDFIHVGIDKPKGYRYKDINTGDIYLIRTYLGKKYYMDIKTGLLVRLTDGEKKKIEIRKARENQKDIKHTNHNKKFSYEKEPEEVIKKINEEQKEYFKKYGKIDYRNSYADGGLDYYED